LAELLERVSALGGIDEDRLPAPLHHEGGVLDGGDREVALLGLDRVLRENEQRRGEHRGHDRLLPDQRTMYEPANNGATGSGIVLEWEHGNSDRHGAGHGFGDEAL